ncbi:MAG: spermidine/putrescine import ATP-binding protein PotA, partial [Pseudomonadota bacterium]
KHQTKSNRDNVDQTYQNHEIPANEFFALLGPSGCGKTTLMRLIAGFETPDEGRIFLDGQDITDLPPHVRPINMMFQSYALFPHMSVAQNIAFGLKQEGRPRQEIASRVEDMLRLVQMSGLGTRRPDQLSGGQRQRVALARALIKRPKLLLLDEPLAALDRKLRHDTQFELMQAQRETGTSFVVVTHDQDEAMVMAHRMAVMRAGAIDQIGAPREVYEEPATRHVAGFVGETNFFEGRVTRYMPGGVEIETSKGLKLEALCRQHPAIGAKVTISIRPENLRLSAPGVFSSNGGAGEILDHVFREGLSSFRVKLDTGDLVHVRKSVSEGGAQHARGERVFVSFVPEHARALLT